MHHIKLILTVSARILVSSYKGSRFELRSQVVKFLSKQVFFEDKGDLNKQKQSPRTVNAMSRRASSSVRVDKRKIHKMIYICI